MNGSYDMSFKIYDAPTGGNQLYSEGPFAVPVDNGVFSIVVGESVPLSSDVFVGGDTHLGLTIVPDSEMTPRHRLVFSPYAYTAAQITSATLLLSGTGNFNAGTSLSVYGADIP